jgi:predicted amidohydrolase
MSRDFSIAAAQSSSIPGDIEANVARHAVFVRTAARAQVNLIVFPELSLTGYEPTVKELKGKEALISWEWSDHL